MDDDSVSGETGKGTGGMDHSNRAYMSFLGAGEYTPVRYTWGGETAGETAYAQEAELELLLARGAVDPSTKVFIFGTPTSMAKHWEALEARLQALAFDPEFVEIDEDLSAEAQWKTFEAVLSKIPHGARLTVDMTNGYRAVPVVFSSALHFLRLAREVRLEHVLYGAVEWGKSDGSILDYASFYAIQDWTDAVSRLVEDADARRLVELAEGDPSLRVVAFEQELTQALMEVTDAVRNVDVHHVEERVRAALELVDQAATRAQAEKQPASQALLKLVQDKFSALASLPPLDGHYTADYFALQRRFIALLLEHRLFMQAFTVMREYVGSLGLRAYKAGSVNFTSSKGRSKRRYADVFLRMLANPRERWVFGEQQAQVEVLLPHYEQLAEAGISEEIRPHLKVITDIRNGFDHAWTTQKQVSEQIAQRGQEELDYLESVTGRILALGAPAQRAASERGERMLVLMNHEATEAQAADAEARLGVAKGRWVMAPEALAAAWRDIDPAAEAVPAELLQQLDAWLEQESKAGDLLWVQGELGATLVAAGRARARGLTPVYATSRRESFTATEADGSVTKTSRFVHVRFRELVSG